MRQAKLSITGDARGFKKATDDSKKALENLGKTKVSDTGLKTLSQQIVDLEKKVKSLSESKALLAKGGIKGEELDAWKKLNKEIKDNKRLIQEAKATRESISSTPDKRDKLPPEEKEEKKKKDKGPSSSDIKNILAVAAGGYGIMSMWSRRVQMAGERLPQRALTTDSGIAGERSSLGFTPEERRSRSLEMAKNASPMKGSELTKLTDLGEQLQRAYGISGDESSGAIGAARKAGVDDQGKFLKQTVGTATNAGMQGNQVSEYLSSMTGFLSEISKGVNIDTDSLNGFAGALGKMPFFKTDPSRIFDMMRGMDQGFKGGDEFQRAQGIRAISKSAPGQEASMYQMREGMGIWGGMDKNKAGDADTLKKLQAKGMNTSALEVTGGQIVQNMMDEIEASTKNMSIGDQAKQLSSRLNISDRAGLELMANKGNIGKMDKVMKNESMSPEEKIKQVMENMDGTIKNVDATLEDMKDAMAEKIADPLAKLATGIDELIKALGLNTEAIGSTVGAIAIVGATIMGAYNLLSKFLPAAEVAAEAAGAAETIAGAGAATATGVGAGIAGMATAGIATALYSPAVGEGSDDTGVSRFQQTGKADKRQQFDFGQNDMFPQLPKSGMSYQGLEQGSNTPTMMNNTGLGSGVVAPTDATEKNTGAIERLTDAILRSMQGGGGGSRFPSNANIGGRNMAMGK